MLDHLPAPNATIAPDLRSEDCERRVRAEGENSLKHKHKALNAKRSNLLETFFIHSKLFLTNSVELEEHGLKRACGDLMYTTIFYISFETLTSQSCLHT